MMFRKIVVTAAIACLVLAFTACGDDDSSSFVEPEKETSSSIAESSSERSGGDPSSPSSSSSSAQSSSKNSSSSAKSSSSTDSKSSSSVTSSSSGTSAGSSAGSSSSSLKTCPPEKEGKTRTLLDSGEEQICQNGYWVPVESSSSADVSSSSYFDMTEQFNPDVEYGEFTDPRDGQKYRTVELKNGVFMESYTVFAENLNYGKMISGGSVQGDSTKYCYDDDPWYCENGWGGLYTWSNAMNFPTVCDSVSIASEKCPNKFNLASENEKFNGKSYFVQHQGICPEGWHVMNENEWVEISEMSGSDVAYYMGAKVAGFGNKNLYGMSLLPAGEWSSLGSKFEVISTFALLWLPQQYPEYDDCAYAAMVKTNEFNRSSRSGKSQGLSIRCVKNY